MGGSCDMGDRKKDEVNKFCFAIDRPPSWTDVIWVGSENGHEQPTYIKYGGYYGHSDSDHVPVFSVASFPHPEMSLESNEYLSSLEEALNSF